METMLTSKDMVEHLQHLYETDQKLHQKLLNAVKKFYKAFKESYQEYKNLDYKNRTAESYEMLKLSKESYRQISKLYAECLKVAAGEYNGKFMEAGAETSVSFSIREIIDENGKSYGMGVYLDSVELEGLDEDERVKTVRKRIKEIGGQGFEAFDKNGNRVTIQIAKKSKKFRNSNGAKINVTNDLTRDLDKSPKSDALMLIDEVIETAQYDDSSPSTNSHGWLDNYGKNDWEYWTTYLEDKNNTIWAATLNVVNTANGEKILYDVQPIKKLGRASATTTSNTDIITTKSESQPDSAKKSGKFSLSDRDSDYTDYDKPITLDDIQKLRTLFPKRKSISSFSDEEIKATAKWAHKYYQQMGVKSPFFRAGFEWRGHDQTPVTAANAKGQSRGLLKNDDTGWNIQVSGKVFSETKTQESAKIEQAKPYLNNINDIVKKSVLLDTQTVGKLKSENSLFMHSLYALADIGNGNEVVKLLVEEMYDPNAKDDNFRAYQLQKIIPAASERVQVSPISSANTAGTIESVADLFSVVKRQDKNFKSREVSTAVLNEDGTPKVFYHGTDVDFTVFDETKGRANMDIQGMFFSPWKLDAAGYGSNVGAYYLNLKNPAPESVAYRVLNSFKGQNGAGKKARDKLIALGYDGVNNSDEEIIAFYPNQIKSATDNIGTFNTNDADIRYSDRNPELVKRQNEVAAAIAKENAKLIEENQNLKELIKLQGQATHGRKFTKSSVDKTAGKQNRVGCNGQREPPCQQKKTKQLIGLTAKRQPVGLSIFFPVSETTRRNGAMGFTFRPLIE